MPDFHWKLYRDQCKKQGFVGHVRVVPYETLLLILISVCTQIYFLGGGGS